MILATIICDVTSSTPVEFSLQNDGSMDRVRFVKSPLKYSHQFACEMVAFVLQFPEDWVSVISHIDAFELFSYSCAFQALQEKIIAL